MKKPLVQLRADQESTAPAEPNFSTGLLQAAQLVATANEVGKSLGWRRPTLEEDEAMNAAADACLRASASNTSLIPGML